MRMHCLEGKDLLVRTRHLLNERWVQIKPLIVTSADRTIHFIFPETRIELIWVKSRFIPWNSKTIPLGLNPFPYCVRQGVNKMRCPFYTEPFTSRDFEPEEK
jgi:hypothetical protein